MKGEAINEVNHGLFQFRGFIAICFNSNQAQKYVAATMIRYLGQMFPETW